MSVLFETVLLGIVVGARPITVLAAPPVAAVELRLDGAAVATLREPPWRFECDFGARPTPHELVAIGRDAAGREVARARQWVNLPRAQCEARLLLERDGASRPIAARLSWDNVESRPPRRLRLTLDGTSVEVKDPQRVPLPRHDPSQPHVLTAEVHFPTGCVARADVVFGGDHGTDTQAELTAVPVVLEPGAALPAAAEMQGWFTAAGEPARVVAIEEGPADVVLVLDQQLERRYATLRLLPYAPPWAILPADDDENRLSLIFAVPDVLALSEERRLLFRVSSPYKLRKLDLQALVYRLIFPTADAANQLIGNAVGIAGVRAAAANRPRAVVLALASPGCTDNGILPAYARLFLADLRVPLHVWSVAEEDTCGWGVAADVTSLAARRKALALLEHALAAQRIVWLEGSHLPQRVSLTERARGIKLAI